MNPLTQFKKIPLLPLIIALALVIGRAPAVHAADLSATPVIDWSNEARRAIVPPGPGGIFGSENYGNKFPGEAAVYMGIVHAAIYDAAVAIEGGYEAYAITLIAPPNTSSAAAIATAAHHTLIGLQPPLGLTPAQQAILDGDYANYLAAIPDGNRTQRSLTSTRRPPAPASGSEIPGIRCLRSWGFAYRASRRSRSIVRRSSGPTGRTL